jgi:hypothetical protein
MKRGWFQIHLSTLGINVFVAGMLLWSNLGRTGDYWYTKSEQFIGHSLGFPFECGRSGILKHFLYGTTRELFEMNYAVAAMDLGVALVVLFVFGFFLEFRIRRREVRER